MGEMIDMRNVAQSIEHGRDFPLKLFIDGIFAFADFDLIDAAEHLQLRILLSDGNDIVWVRLFCDNQKST